MWSYSYLFSLYCLLYAKWLCSLMNIHNDQTNENIGEYEVSQEYEDDCVDATTCHS